LLGRGERSSARWWLASGLGGETRSSTLLRRSRGMAGMRNYYDRERGHLAVLDQAVVQRVSMDARGISRSMANSEGQRYMQLLAAGMCKTGVPRYCGEVGFGV
jgi:hypothetical protein